MLSRQDIETILCNSLVKFTNEHGYLGFDVEDIIAWTKSYGGDEEDVNLVAYLLNNMLLYQDFMISDIFGE